MNLNKIRYLPTLIIILTITSQIRANDTKKTYEDHDHTNESGAYLEKGLVQNIYNNISAKSQNKSKKKSGIHLSPQLGLFSPSHFNLDTEYFHTNYKKNFGNVLLIKIELLKVLGNLKYIEAFMISSIGYSFKQGTYKTTSSSGFQVEDTISFQWVPITAGTELKLKFLSTSFFSPSIKIQAGGSWFHQSGTIDGFNQGFWVPFYSVGTTFKINLNRHNINNNNNFTFGIDYQKSINKEQNFEGLTYFLGIHFAT